MPRGHEQGIILYRTDLKTSWKSRSKESVEVNRTEQPKKPFGEEAEHDEEPNQVQLLTELKL